MVQIYNRRVWDIGLKDLEHLTLNITYLPELFVDDPADKNPNPHAEKIGLSAEKFRLILIF
jgi:hypothetical protein